MRRGLTVLFLTGLCAGFPGVAQEPAPSTAQVPETLAVAEDRTRRMTVPVSIDGSGPYGFVVDTGAERTAISRELAEELGLGPGRAAILVSMTERTRTATALIPSLEVGRRTVTAIHAPTLDRHHLGAEGLLGIDSLRDQRVELDFVRNEMQVSPSRRTERRWPSDSIVVTGRRILGQLVLVDAEFDGERVWVIVDTGSQVTIANDALRRRLARRGRIGPLHPVQLMSVTGGTMMAEYGSARQIRIGGAEIRNLPVAFAEVRPFRQLGLTDRPAMLLGMDALRLFDRVSIDFPRHRLRLLPRDSSSLSGPVRLAATFRPTQSQAARPAAVSRSSDNGSSRP
jgi:predicted aspartyl protease